MGDGTVEERRLASTREVACFVSPQPGKVGFVVEILTRLGEVGSSDAVVDGHWFDVVATLTGFPDSVDAALRIPSS